MSTLWVKNPLAIFTRQGVDAGGGVVVQDTLITELVPSDRKPETGWDSVFDARRHVVLPGCG